MNIWLQTQNKTILRFFKSVLATLLFFDRDLDTQKVRCISVKNNHVL